MRSVHQIPVLAVALSLLSTVCAVAAQDPSDELLRLDTELQALLMDDAHELEEARALFINIIQDLDTPVALALLENNYYRHRGIMNRTSSIGKAFRQALVATAREEATRLFLDRFLSGEYMRIEVPAGEEWSENLRRHELSDMIQIAPAVLEPERNVDLLTSLFDTVSEKNVRFRRHVRHSLATALVEVGTNEAFDFLHSVRDEIQFGGYYRWRLCYSPDDRAAEILLYRLENVDELLSVDYSWGDDKDSKAKRSSYMSRQAHTTLLALVGEFGLFDRSEWLIERRKQKKGVELWSLGTLGRIRAQLGALTPRLLEYGIDEDEIKRVKDRLDEIIQERRRDR